ncbi:MAG: glycoside hydrolase family 36 protein [Phycisphaerales bacterium]
MPVSKSAARCSDAARITCDAQARTLSLDAGCFSATGGGLTIAASDATYTLDRAESCRQADDGSVVVRWPGLQACLRWDADGAVTLELTNTSEQFAVIVREIVFRFEPACFASVLAAPAFHQVVHSREAAIIGGVKAISLPTAWSKQIDPPSHLYTIYRNDQTGQALLLGALPPFGGSFTIFQTLHDTPHGQGHWGLEVRHEFHQQLNPGASLRTSSVIVRQSQVGGDGRPLLDAYAGLMRGRLLRPRKPRATGWNSWDYYAGAIQRRDMDANAQAARELFGDRLRYIVIDEGYECMWGVWQANWKFPEGLADYCRHIQSLGYKPGIWTAPLMVNMYTPLYREHGDWFVGNADGSPHLEALSYGAMAQLDITHPGVQEHLRGIYRRLVEDGFEYFKCDFAQMLMNASRFHDPTVGRADLLRRLFQLIRDCIGEERYLLSCLTPFESVIGIVDSQRTTGDIHAYWSHIRHDIQVMFQRLWMQGTVGNTDPDFMIVRSDETGDDRNRQRRMAVQPESPDEYWCRGPTMTLEQARVLALAVHLTGGDLVFGDALHKLNDRGVEVLRHLADAPTPAPGRLLNLLTPGQALMPVVIAPTPRGSLMGLFNLGDVPCLHQVDLTHARRITDFWTNQPARLPADGRITLQPRSAMGLYLESDTPG